MFTSFFLGQCNTDCIPFSRAFMIHAVATNYVLLDFRHWAIYVDVICYRHCCIERWCVEKIMKQVSDIRPSDKCIQLNNVWVSNSQYSCYLFWRYLASYNYPCCDFNELLKYILAMTTDSYNVMFNNCRHFCADICRLMF